MADLQIAGRTRPSPSPGGSAGARAEAGLRSFAGGRLGLLAFLIYLVVSLVYFGRPVLGHPRSTAIALNDVDSSQYMWFLAWWPHAILHGQNPIFEHVTLVPEGFNLAWATSLAGPALVLSPITLAFGPLVAYNVFALLAPVVTGWTAFLLCRHLTRSFWASLAGGYAFGFSGFTLAMSQGAPWLALAAFLPIVLLLVLKRLDGTLGPRWFVGGMAAAIAFEFLIATEFVATTTLFCGIAALLAYGLFPDRRPALRDTGLLVLAAFGVAGIVLSPMLISMLHAHEVPNQAITFSKAPTDPVSFFIPTDLQLKSAFQVARWKQLGISGNANGVAYLGLPLVLIVGAFAWTRRRERLTWLLVGTLAVVVVATLGRKLFIGGHATSIPLPWEAMSHLPLLRYALPYRFAVFAAFIAAIILALWIARPGHPARWVVVALALLALAPHFSSNAWHSGAYTPAFFKHDAYKTYLHPHDNVITIPVTASNQRWQAETGFNWRMVGGYLGAFPKAYTKYPAWDAILNGKRPPGWRAKFAQYVAAKHATALVVDKRYLPAWKALFAPLGFHPIDTGGVLFYRLGPAPS